MTDASKARLTSIQAPSRLQGPSSQHVSAPPDTWGPASLPTTNATDEAAARAHSRMSLASSMATASASAFTIAARRASALIPHPRARVGRQQVVSPRQSLAQVDPSNQWSLLSGMLDAPSHGEDLDHAARVSRHEIPYDFDEEEDQEYLGSPSPSSAIPLPEQAEPQDQPARLFSPPASNQHDVFVAEPDLLSPPAPTGAPSKMSPGSRSASEFVLSRADQPVRGTTRSARSAWSAQSARSSLGSPSSARGCSPEGKSPEERRRSSYFGQAHGDTLGPEADTWRRGPVRSPRMTQSSSARRLSRDRLRLSQHLPTTIPPIPLGFDPITFVASQAAIPPSPATTPIISTIPTVPHSVQPSLRVAASRLLLAHADEDADCLLMEKESAPTSVLPFWRQYLYPHSALSRNIAKCALAYFLCSMFTFSPVLSDFMAHWLPHHNSDRRAPIANLHMVATVSVYFHAARTYGGMVLANGYALLGLSVVILWCTLSMWIAETLHELGHPSISNALVLGLFVGVGVGVGSWSKTQPHLAPPVWNTTGTMGSILLFVVLVKEGTPHLGRFSGDKVIQVASCCIIGTLLTTTVCLFLWPQSATTRLQSGIKKDLDAFARLLRAITTVFLLDENEPVLMLKDTTGTSSSQRALVGAIGRHGSSFTRAQTETEEACLESWVDPRMSNASVRQAYRGVAQSLTRLAQHLAALRAPCNAPSHIALRTLRAGGSLGASHTTSSAISSGAPDVSKLPPVYEDPMTTSPTPASFSSATGILGPDIRSLAFTCSRTLLALKDAFPSAEDSQNEGAGDEEENLTSTYGATQSGASVYESGMPLSWLGADLSAAVQRFSAAQTQFNAGLAQNWVDRAEPVVASGSQGGQFKASQDARLDVDGVQGENAVQEDTYLVVFYAWTLSEFAGELKRLIPHLEVVRKHEGHLAHDQQRARTNDSTRTLCGWTWHLVRELLTTIFRPLVLLPAFLAAIVKVAVSSFYSLCQKVGQDVIPSGQFDSSGRPSRRNGPSVPGYMPHYPGTLQTPPHHDDEGWRSRWADRLWRATRLFHRNNVRFAIKAGGGAAVLAMPAFIMRTRPLFERIQGQWALVSYFVVMSPTVGQSTYMGLQRTAGTIIGALAATIAYNIFPDDNVGLPLFGLLFVVPCFYIIVATPARASSGRLVLLAYNLTALYSYNIRKTGTEVEQIAIFRTLSVLLGVAWAAFVTAFVWPMEARRLLVQGTSDVIFNLAWLYQSMAVRAVSSRKNEPQLEHHDPAADFFGSQGELALLAQHRRPGRMLSVPPKPNSVDDSIASMTLSIQVALIWLEGLLPHTSTELRLKGPFPREAYLQILSSAQGFLDALHGLSAVSQLAKDAARVRPVTAAYVASNLAPKSEPTRTGPAETVQDALALELTGHTVLVLYLLAASFRLRTPLPPFMPRVEATRKKLVAFHPTMVTPPMAPLPPGKRSGTPSPERARHPHVKDDNDSEAHPPAAPPSAAPPVTPQLPLPVRSPVLSAATQRAIRSYSYALGMKEVSRHLELLVDLTQRTLGVVGDGYLAFPS